MQGTLEVRFLGHVGWFSFSCFRVALWESGAFPMEFWGLSFVGFVGVSRGLVCVRLGCRSLIGRNWLGERESGDLLVDGVGFGGIGFLGYCVPCSD